MWRRLVSSHLTTLAAASSSSSIQSVASIAEPSFLASRPSTPFRPSSSVLARYFATESEVSKKKVEVVNPIATGHEREELEAELQGKDNLEINYPVGPFGTQGSKLSEDCSVLYGFGLHSLAFFRGSARLGIPQPATSLRFFTAAASPVSQNSTALETDVPARIKFKRLDKTARHIMQILDKEAVEDVKTDREIPDIKPGYIVQLKLEVPENKRRITTIKGIVIARRNAGLNTTFRIRRLVAGVGVESLLPLYSPNIKEIKVLDKKKVRRAKLYYLREKMNALRK